jgi:hypothetical protein
MPAVEIEFMRVRYGAVVLLCALTAFFARPGPAGGQVLQAGRGPTGVEVSLEHDRYRLRGETAQELLVQLRVLAPDVGWVWFPYRYTWRYDVERVMLRSGIASANCIPQDFRVDLDFTAVYPEWVRPSDASEELVAAWQAFEGQVVRSWEASRAAAVARFRSAQEAIRRTEELCETLDERIEFLVRGAFDSEPPQRLVDGGPPPGMRWPPEGFDHLLMVQAGAPPPPRQAPPSASFPPVAERAPLAPEVALVDRAHAALRRGDAPAALAELASYEQDFSEPRLLPEVLALRMEASDRLGDATAARFWAGRLLGRFPRSAQAARARALLER